MYTVSQDWIDLHKQQMIPAPNVNMILWWYVEGDGIKFQQITREMIKSATLTVSQDPIGATVPQVRLRAVIDNQNNIWSPTSPTGLWNRLTENTYITFGSSYSDLTPPASVTYLELLNFWELSPDGTELTIEAGTCFNLGNEPYSSATTSGTFADIAHEAVRQIASKVWFSIFEDFDASLSSYTTIVGSGLTASEVLQLTANAMNCVLSWNLPGQSEDVNIKPLDLTLTDAVITRDLMFTYPQITYDLPIKEIVVEWHGGLKETVALSNEYGGTQTIKNPMISNSGIARRVGQQAAAILKSRMKLTVEWRPDLRITVGDVITVEGIDNQKYYVIVTDLDYTFDGGWRGTLSGRVLGQFEPISDEVYSMNAGDIIFTRET